MKFSKINFETAYNLVEMERLLSPLLNNGYGFEDFYDYLKGVDLYTPEGLFHGFLSCETTEDGVEVHAFFSKKERRNSIKVLKHFRDYILKVSGKGVIFTSVTGDFEYIIRVLKFIGFKPYDVEESCVHKDSGTFDITYLKYEV